MTFAELGPYAVAAVLALAAFLFVRRYGAGTAMATLEQANRILEKRVTDQDAEIRTLTMQVETLRSRTDVALAMAPVLEALRSHERQAEKRASASLAVLELIADHLGPESSAAAA